MSDHKEKVDDVVVSCSYRSMKISILKILTLVFNLQLEKTVAQNKVVIGDEAFQQAMIKEPPSWVPPPVLLAACVVAFCCSTSNGYDGSLFGTLLANKWFKEFFAVSNAGIEAGTFWLCDPQTKKTC